MPVGADSGGLARLIDAHFDSAGEVSPDRIGVAVSGGGDSVALLLLLHDRFAGRPGAVEAVTVDHGLRAEAAAEAAAVGRLCAGIGVAHTTLRWTWDGLGNLPDRARRGRVALISDWARSRGLADVALGHTAEDQAETLLMRLARGSGVDGLACMRGRRQSGGLTWHRPLLSAHRSALRAFLSGRNVGWAEDPSNDDPGYDRVKARKALAVLEPLGLTVETLTQTAGRMLLAREVLDDAVMQLAHRAAEVEAGDVIFDRAELAGARTETCMRLLSGAVRWITVSDYRPRWQSLVNAYDAAAAGRAHALAGCLFLPSREHLRLTREHQALLASVGPTRDLWDGRWQFKGPHADNLVARATGEDGLAQVPDWRDAGLPRRAAIATPSVWDGTRLVAAPLLGKSDGWEVRLASDRPDFPECLMIH